MYQGTSRGNRDSPYTVSHTQYQAKTERNQPCEICDIGDFSSAIKSMIEMQYIDSCAMLARLSCCVYELWLVLGQNKDEIQIISACTTGMHTHLRNSTTGPVWRRVDEVTVDGTWLAVNNSACIINLIWDCTISIVLGVSRCL